jgi:hypothetical protein
VTAEVDIAEGAAGPDTRARHRQIARTKFVDNAAPLLGVDRAHSAAAGIEALPGADTAAVRALLDGLAAALR